VILTTRFDRLFWKYPGDRAYPMALSDIGYLVQTFQPSRARTCDYRYGAYGTDLMGCRRWPSCD
jgi:hypothetical protein